MNDKPTPDAERLKRVNALLEVVLSLPEGERKTWLKTLSPDQQPLVPMLSAMLARAPVETDTFLRRPLGISLGELGDLDTPQDQPGDEVGLYRLIRELGVGGMATVWLAERADGVLHRQVALKLPRAGWALGLAQRMARERDILGALEHPRIARLYDAGVTASGRPWMAMEYVTGVPIDAHCREQGLAVRERLRLFLQVADAVAYAHTRLIVHRDLKPSNILVTPDGEVRLLDFGVAKLLEDEPAPAANLTQLMGRAVTPDYASPEQVGGKPVTVATDVYSLGVVLYELLVGQRPYRLGRPTAAALEEAILCADVPLASSRVQSDRRLARQLRGDLDNVLAKSLKKGVRQRYASVESFAADLQRHLDGEPVLARPDGGWYRAVKFVKRHRGAVASTALVFAAVVAGLLGTMTQASRADRLAQQAQQERDSALRELRYAEAAEAFMRSVLGAGPTNAVTTPELLARADEAVDLQYANDAELRARLQIVVSDLFAEQRDYKRAQAVLDRAWVSAQASGDMALRAGVECRQAELFGATGATDKAEKLFADTIRQISSRSAQDEDALATCYSLRSGFNVRMARPQASIDDAKKALRLMGTPRPSQAVVASSLRTQIANAQSELGQIASAVELLDKELDVAARAGPGGATLATAIANNLGVTLGRAGELQRAARAYERGLAVVSQSGGPNDHALTISYARLLVELGRANDAIPLLERATTESQRAGDPLFHAIGTFGSATAYCELRNWARCATLLDAAREKLRTAVPPDRAIWGTVEVVAARASMARGNLPLARQQLRTAVALYDSAADRSAGRVRALSLLARVEAQLGEPTSAQAHVTKAMEAALMASNGFPHSEWIGSALLAQAVVERAQGDSAAARRTVREALDHLRPSAGDRAPSTNEAEQLARALGA